MLFSAPIVSSEATVALTYQENGPRYVQRLTVPISHPLWEGGAQAQRQAWKQANLTSLLSSKLSRLSFSSLCISEIQRM